MPRLPVLSSGEVVKTFELLGWTVARPGAHIVMTKAGSSVTLSVPNHKEVARGTRRALIRSAGVTVDEFVAASR